MSTAIASRSRAVPRPGGIALGSPRLPLPRPGSKQVPRITRALPRSQSLALQAQPDRTVGRTELGLIAVADGVVATIAGRAVLDVPDAGGVATSILGSRALGGHLGMRETSLDSQPKTTASVDGTRVWVSTAVSIRWPAPIAEVAEEIRASIRSRVEHMANLEVAEVEIHVDALVERRPNAPRVR